MDEYEIQKSTTEWASDEYCSLIWNMFYKDYEIKPFISKYRELYTKWLSEPDSMFPPRLVKKEDLQYYDDGLLPGHIYLIYWLNKQKSTIKYPVYFEFEYGINPQFARNQLFEHGFIDDNNRMTDKGLSAVKNHIDIIEERHPQPKHTYLPLLHIPVDAFPKFDLSRMNEGYSKIPDSDLGLVNTTFDLTNKLIKDFLCQIHYETIHQITDLIYEIDYTFYIYEPYTDTGRRRHLPFSVVFSSKKDNDLDFPFIEGGMSYDRDGIINEFAATFRRPETIMIYGKQVKGEIFIDKADTLGVSKIMPLYRDKNKPLVPDHI